jgi:hypothetical protein
MSRETYQVRVFNFFDDCYIVKLDVQVLVHALQCSSYGDIVFEFDCDFVIDQSLEKAVKELVLFQRRSQQDGPPEEQHLEICDLKIL